MPQILLTFLFLKKSLLNHNIFLEGKLILAVFNFIADYFLDHSFKIQGHGNKLMNTSTLLWDLFLKFDLQLSYQKQ